MTERAIISPLSQRGQAGRQPGRGISRNCPPPLTDNQAQELFLSPIKNGPGKPEPFCLRRRKSAFVDFHAVEYVVDALDILRQLDGLMGLG